MVKSKKKFLTALLVCSLASGLVFAETAGAHSYSIPNKAWNDPGHGAPVLHQGSVKGAGMRQQPLQDIDAVLHEAIEEKTTPGAVVLVARNGHIVKQQAYGDAARYVDDAYTEMENPVAMQTDTIFDVASISKIFTTVAAMKLYEKGAIQLDAPVAKYIPEFAASGKETVTIRQLMTHTSGFTAWIPLHSQGETREDRLQLVFAQPLEAQPGSVYTYSDLNMITLGAVVEKLSGKRLDQFVKDEITKPLGMKDTMYNPPASLKNRIAATEFQPEIGRGLVWGEVHDENAWSLDGVAGHAGVFSTAKDLGIFAHMILNEGKYGGKRILKPATVQLLSENQIPEFDGDDHGLGWELNQGWYMDALSGPSSAGHTGFTGTSIVINQKNKTIAILLTNRVHPTRKTISLNSVRRDFVRRVADAIPAPIPKNTDAWFSGYGDKLHRDLLVKATKEVNEVSFDTWYEVEKDSDFGVVEASGDGISWSEVGTRLTGTNDKWSNLTVMLPEGTKQIRFRYETDASVNGRGWYVGNIKLNGQLVNPESDATDWENRNY
ncbi:serine hydrolase domain-containing protein [Sporosarcina gallistercoris]|uniref:Serine hydrolase n=1 Tax=Sporosarcina gallistercoris TaxID=2762245 RepID=A0ABR8PK74_9BACL|nr:serine hydrolase domain-containing protein [Sporosarcina gallistercoris]MBD7908542.1 serine hydrolase [Sporosarcina gallistercoris]